MAMTPATQSGLKLIDTINAPSEFFSAGTFSIYEYVNENKVLIKTDGSGLTAKAVAAGSTNALTSSIPIKYRPQDVEIGYGAFYNSNVCRPAAVVKSNSNDYLAFSNNSAVSVGEVFRFNIEWNY